MDLATALGYLMVGLLGAVLGWGLCKTLGTTADEQVARLRYENAGLHNEIARLADRNGTAEAERNNALELAEHYRQAALAEKSFGDLRRERYSAVTTDELELERRSHEAILWMEAQEAKGALARKAS